LRRKKESALGVDFYGAPDISGGAPDWREYILGKMVRDGSKKTDPIHAHTKKQESCFPDQRT
jgi:hypothetical protein